MERKMDIPNTLVGRLIEEARDSRRPSMDDVLAVIDAAFSSMSISVEPASSGPPTWVWRDLEMESMGFPRSYVLSESLEYPGYPLFTIRQAYSVKFDTWISMSGLVIGPEASGITRSICLAMVNHAGAFAGVRFAANSVQKNEGVPIAGMVAVKMLMEAEPPTITAEQVEETLELTDEGQGPKRVVN
jgi:hypothetical protein